MSAPGEGLLAKAKDVGTTEVAMGVQVWMIAAVVLLVLFYLWWTKKEGMILDRALYGGGKKETLKLVSPRVFSNPNPKTL